MSKHSKTNKKPKQLFKKELKITKGGRPRKMSQGVADYIRAELITLIIRAGTGSSSAFDELLEIIPRYTKAAEKVKKNKKLKNMDRAVLFQHHIIDSLYEATHSSSLTQILRGRLSTQTAVVERRKIEQLLGGDKELKEDFMNALGEEAEELLPVLTTDATSRDILKFYNTPIPVDVISGLRERFNEHSNLIELNWIKPLKKSKVKVTPANVGIVSYMKLLTLVYRFIRLQEISFTQNSGLSPIGLFTSVLHIHGEEQGWIYNEAIKMLVSDLPDNDLLFLELVTEHIPDSIEEEGFEPEYYLEFPIVQFLHELGHHFLEEWDAELLAQVMADNDDNLHLIADYIADVYSVAEDTVEELSVNTEYMEEGCVVYEAMENFYVSRDPDPLELALELSRLIRILAFHLTNAELEGHYSKKKFNRLVEEYVLLLFSYRDE